MRSKKHRVQILSVVTALKSVACDSARAEFALADQRAEHGQRQLADAQAVESARSAGVMHLLQNMPAFDPVIYQNGVASIQAAQMQTHAMQTHVAALNSERELAREQMLLATAGHQFVQKAHLKSLGKLQRAQLQAAEYAREDTITNRQRSLHDSFKPAA